MAAERVLFASRDEFRQWLEANGETSEGVWLIFGKTGGPKTLKAGEALEEALCFGWIDGQMQSVDEGQYIKYFAQRRKGSKWSDKNKGIAEKLEKQGLMTPRGRAKIQEAKENGQWDKPKAAEIGEAQIEEVACILKGHTLAYDNFMAMPPSVKKTYTRAYFDAKTEAGRASRLAWMVERLEKGLRPM